MTVSFYTVRVDDVTRSADQFNLAPWPLFVVLAMGPIDLP